MDKTGIIVVSLCVALLGYWMYDQNKKVQEQIRWQQAHPSATGTSQSSNGVAGNQISTNANGTVTTNIASTMATTATGGSAAVVSLPATGAEQTITLTNGA